MLAARQTYEAARNPASFGALFHQCLSSVAQLVSVDPGQPHSHTAIGKKEVEPSTAVQLVALSKRRHPATGSVHIHDRSPKFGSIAPRAVSRANESVFLNGSLANQNRAT